MKVLPIESQCKTLGHNVSPIMSTATALAAPPLEAGDFLSREQFLDRWETLPELRFAELIRGIVYMASPVGYEHGDIDLNFGTLLKVYAARTPGCGSGVNTTWLMLDDAPQPETFLRLEEACGGHSRLERKYVTGAPEFVVEVSASSASYDLHQKLDLYEEAGVDEYLVILLWEKQVRWHRKLDGELKLHSLPEDSVVRSSVFPGLWIDTTAALRGDMGRALDVLQAGITSPEHSAFVERLGEQLEA